MHTGTPHALLIEASQVTAGCCVSRRLAVPWVPQELVDAQGPTAYSPGFGRSERNVPVCISPIFVLGLSRS